MFKTTPGLFNTCAVFVAGLNSYHLPKANNSFVITKQYTHKFGTDCVSETPVPHSTLQSFLAYWRNVVSQCVHHRGSDPKLLVTVKLP